MSEKYEMLLGLTMDNDFKKLQANMEKTVDEIIFDILSKKDRRDQRNCCDRWSSFKKCTPIYCPECGNKL